LGIDAIALHDYVETKSLLSKSRLTKPLAAGGPAYFLSIMSRTVPGYFLRGHPEVRVVNEGGPAVLIGADGRPVTEIPRGETLYQGPSRMVAMSTIPYWGFGARIFPYADEREDRFNLRIVDVDPIQVAIHLRSIWKGSYRGRAVRDFLCEEISIHYDSPMPMQIGGDPAGEHSSVRARLAPRRIEVVDYYAPPPTEHV
jgi:hypothetical protein